MKRLLSLVLFLVGVHLAPRVEAEDLYVLTDAGTLFRIDGFNPTVPFDEVTITGLGAGETLIGIDTRPIDGIVYGVSTGARLYTINPKTGVATLADVMSEGLLGTAF